MIATKYALLDYLSELVVLCDQHQRILFANKKALSAFDECDIGNFFKLPLKDPLTKLKLGDDTEIGVSANGRYYTYRKQEIDDEGRVRILFTFTDITTEFIKIEKLKDSEHTLKQLIDLVPHAIFLKDSQRRFRIINKAVAAHHQLDKEDMLGKRDEDFFKEEDVVAFIRDEETILKTKEPRFIPEESFTNADGELKVMETIKVPFFIQSLNEWGILGVAIDITQRKKLQEQQTKLRLEYQKTLMNAVLNAQERERSKIAADIHDGLGQLLTAAKMNLNAFTSQVEKTAETSFLQKSEDLLEQSIQEVRNITRDLVPGVLHDFGLVTALELLVDASNALTKTRFTYRAHNVDEKMHPQVENNLYRISQEIVNNAIKYAQADEVTIQLFGRDNEVVLQIEDDGIGFDFEKTMKENKGLGLKSIVNRVDLLNGTIDIDTRPGRGCEYNIIVNLKEIENNGAN